MSYNWLFTLAPLFDRKQMPFRLIHQSWFDEFKSALSDTKKDLHFVSPFIKLGITKQLLQDSALNRTRVITRLNKTDFLNGVSDTEALRFLLDSGAEIHGIKGLHSKLYIFDDSQAIVTSANLTHKSVILSFAKKATSRFWRLTSLRGLGGA